MSLQSRFDYVVMLGFSILFEWVRVAQSMSSGRGWVVAGDGIMMMMSHTTVVDSGRKYSFLFLSHEKSPTCSLSAITMRREEKNEDVWGI